MAKAYTMAENAKPHLVVPVDAALMSGGMPRSIELLMRNLPTDLEPLVVTPANSEVATAIRALGVPVVESPGLSRWIVTWKQPLNTARTFAIARPLVRSLLSRRSIILTNNVPAEVVCGLGKPFGRVPRVFVHRGFSYNGILRHTVKRSLASCSAYVATTRYQQDLLVNELGAPKDRVHLIPNGVQIEDYAVLERMQRPEWWTPGVWHIGVLGYPDPNKNQELLLRSVAVLRGKQLPVVGVLCGSPKTATQRQYLNHLRGLAHDLGVGAHFLFLEHHADPRAVYAGLDIVVSTSIKEGFGRTIIEAMAARRPVVALKAGGPESILRDGETGLLVDYNDAEVFAAKLHALVKSLPLWRGLVDRAYRCCVAQYDARAVAASYARVLLSTWSHCTRIAAL